MKIVEIMKWIILVSLFLVGGMVKGSTSSAMVGKGGGLSNLSGLFQR